MNIKIDYTRDKLLDKYGKSILYDRLLLPDEKSPQDGFARAARAWADDEGHAQRIYDYASKLWFMFASPPLSNGGTKKGMPISCFLSYVGDSRSALSKHYDENIWLSSEGGGIGSYWGDVRSNGSKTSTGGRSTGSIPFIGVVDRQMLAFSQGTTRRGSYAAYSDISHPEIEEFIVMRKPTGGDANRKCLNLHHGVNITDEFMKIIRRCEIDPTANDDWNLIDPNSKKVVKTVSALALWESILLTRLETGEPYIHFIDTTHALQPECHKKMGLRVHTSNLCSEIVLPTSEERTAVCCLSSVNLEYYDEWKDTNMVNDLVRMLDNILTYFINNARPEMKKAVYSATQERSIGLGAMGFHSYLQKNMIPFGSSEADIVNQKMFATIMEKANAESIELGLERGIAPDFNTDMADKQDDLDYSHIGRRNVHLIAVAPNATSSIICGNTSPSIEPFAANAYRQDTLTGSFVAKNKHLNGIFKGKLGTLYGNDPEKMKYELKKLWKSVADNEGSVQHLDILAKEEKEVFRTAVEIDQMDVIKHAASRQRFIDQAQSVNLFFPREVSKAYLHHVHMEAWLRGLKTLYYVRPKPISRAENINTKFERHSYEEAPKNNDIVCVGCEG